MSASSQIGKDADEALSESSWRVKWRNWKKEVRGPGLKATVGPRGEMSYRSGRVKAARKDRGELKEAEIVVDGEAPPSESAEIQSSKRKVIRVESEETQYHVCEALAIAQEEAEEITFVLSALGEARGPSHWCDNRCSEKAVR